MSHKSTIKMKINDRDALLESLKHMGVEYEIAETENGLKVNSRYGVKADVDIKLKKDAHGNRMSSVGFKKCKDGSYEATGDFYEINRAKTKDGERLSEYEFKKTISKRYSYFKAVEELSKNGFTMQQDVVDFTKKELSFVMQTQF